MKRILTSLLFVTISCAVSHGATTLTNHVLVHFNGSVSGTTYTLGSGEVDTTGTFKANGTPTLSASIATLDGGTSNDGFDFNPTSIGNLTTLNWVAEAVLTFNAFESGFRTIIDVYGDTDFRVNSAGTQLEALYWDGSTDSPILTRPLPATGESVHYALVWNASASALTAYINGVSIGTTDHAVFASPDTTNVSFGYFGRNPFNNRGVNGSLDRVAFSTFTGSFDASSDFVALVPEPGSSLLIALSGLLCLGRRRR